MTFFDTHAHYDDQRFDADRDEILRALPGYNVGLVLNPGCDLESSRKAVSYAETYPHVYAAVGYHPENIDGVPDAEAEAGLKEIEALARLGKSAWTIIGAGTLQNANASRSCSARRCAWRGG